MANVSTETVTVELGGLADSIRDQFKAQGIRIPGHATASLERTRCAIIQLRAAGILTRAQRDAADRRFVKLVRRIVGHYRSHRRG